MQEIVYPLSIMGVRVGDGVAEGGAERSELSSAVSRIYRLADANPEEPPGIVRLCDRFLGRPSVLRASDALDQPAALRVPARGRPHILVWSKVTSDVTVSISRELVRWCEREGLVQVAPDIADDVARAVVLPAPALARAVRIERLSVPQIADAFDCPIWLVVTRLAQVRLPVGSGEYRAID